MGKQFYFRYKDSKSYENYSSYLEFIKSIPLTIKEIEELDEYGYNILHYCSLKSNISSNVLEYILSFSPNMYILSGAEFLTAFELAFIKNSTDKCIKFTNNGYNHTKEDEFGFLIEDKFERYIKQNPEFYKSLIQEYNINIQTKETVVRVNPLISQSEAQDPKLNVDVISLRMRMEMENKLFELIKYRIGSELEDLIVNKSLHELILNSFSLRLVSYEQKETFIKAKQVFNHFCHYQAAVDNKIEWFMILSQKERDDYLEFVQREINGITVPSRN